MIGIVPEKARHIFDITEGFEAWTGMAIGYQGDPITLPDALKERDSKRQGNASRSLNLYSAASGEILRRS